MSIISNLTDRAYNSYIESTQVASKPGIVVLNPDGSSLTGVGSAGINQAATASAANSTTTTLLANAVFTGTSESTLSYEGISVMVFADQGSATNGLSIQQSKDGTNWDVTDTYTVTASTTLAVVVHFVAENFRVVYTNGGVAQGTFRLDTVKKPILNPLARAVTPSGAARMVVSDPTTLANQAAVQAFHNSDNQSFGATTYGLFTGGVAQLLNIAGNIDRQRETGIDSIASVGVATGSAQFAMAFLTTDSTDNFAAGTRTFTPVAMSGTIGGNSWSIQVGSVLTLDTGAAKENVVVTAVTGTTFTCVTANAHNGTVTPFNIVGFVYNQERDAAGELDGALGKGTAIAAGYEYNSGGPGTSNNNFDRERNLQGKGRTTSTLNSAAMSATTGVTSIVFTAATNLQPGQPVYFDLIGAANFEVLYTALNYTAGSTTVLLQSGNVNTHANGVTVAWDTYIAGGPGVSGFLPTGVGIEEEALFDPVNNLYYIERSATQDTAVGQNIVMENSALFSGTTNFERSRSITALSQSTLNGTLNSYTNSGTGIPIYLSMGYDSTAAANAYRGISVDASGRIITSATTPTTVVGTLTNNNAAPAANNLGVLSALANAVAPTWTEGDQTLLSLNLKGEIRALLSQAGNPAIISNAIPAGGAIYGLTVRPYTMSDGTNTMPTMDAAARVGFVRLSDGTTNTNVIAATNALKIDNSSIAGTATVTAAAGVQKVGIVGNANGVMDAAGQNATSPANELLVAGQFNTVPTTILSGNISPIQLDNAANLLTKVNVALPTGANTIGAVTQASGPWTSNVTQINSVAISTSAAGIQKVGITGNAGAIFDAAGQNVLSPANEILVGGQFNTTPTTIVSGNMSPLQLDNAANLLTSTLQLPAQAAPSDGLGNANASRIQTMNLQYAGGNTWHRVYNLGSASGTTSAGALANFTNTSTGMPMSAAMGYDSTAGATAYRAMAVDASGNLKASQIFNIGGTVALNAYSVRITTATTTTPTAATGYIASIAYEAEVAGAGSTITIRDKSASPLVLVNAVSGAAAFTTPTTITFNAPIKFVGGIDIVTTSVTPATWDVWITYWA